MEATRLNHITRADGQNSTSIDVEKDNRDTYLQNTSVYNFTWHGITATVKDRKKKQDKRILNDIQGIVNAGEAYESYPVIRLNFS